MSFLRPEQRNEELSPESDLIQGDGLDTLIIYLPPGFQKEHMKVQRDDRGNLKVVGARLDRKRWSKFQRHFHISKDCDVAGIRAKLDENNRLFVYMPKFHQEANKGEFATGSPEIGDPYEQRRWRGRIVYPLVLGAVLIVGFGAYMVWNDS